MKKFQEFWLIDRSSRSGCETHTENSSNHGQNKINTSKKYKSHQVPAYTKMICQSISQFPALAKRTTERSLYPAIFSTARLMNVAIMPVRSPTRKASVHFKKIYCNTWTFDLLLQSCLKRSFSLILYKKNLLHKEECEEEKGTLESKNRVRCFYS